MKELFYTKEFEFFFERIKANHHFKYARFNDGELIAIIGKTPDKANCDKHKYFPGMSVELKQVFLDYKHDEDYILETFDRRYSIPMFREILDELKVLNPELSFVNTDFIRIAHEQEPDKFKSLLTELKTKKLIIVGPQYLGKLSKFFKFNHIVVPLRNCYLAKDNIIDLIKKTNTISDNNYYLFSASMPTKIIIDAFKEDTKNTYIDWGSVWDTFFVSREYRFISKRTSTKPAVYRKIYKSYLI